MALRASRKRIAIGASPLVANAASHTSRAGSVTPKVTFHALRHYYASLLIRHGESVTTVQARLGHASASETLNTYAHLWPDAEDRTRQAVDDVMLRAAAERQELDGATPTTYLG